MGRSHCRERLSESPVPCMFPSSALTLTLSPPEAGGRDAREHPPLTVLQMPGPVQASMRWVEVDENTPRLLEKSMRKSGEDSTDEHPRVSVPSYTTLSSHSRTEEMCASFSSVMLADSFRSSCSAGRWSLISQFWIPPSSEAISRFQEDELHSVQIPETAPVRAGCAVLQITSNPQDVSSFIHLVLGVFPCTCFMPFIGIRGSTH